MRQPFEVHGASTNVYNDNKNNNTLTVVVAVLAPQDATECRSPTLIYSPRRFPNSNFRQKSSSSSTVVVVVVIVVVLVL